MKTIKLAPGERLVTNQLNRKGVLPQNIIDAARDIVANVRVNGDAAVRDYSPRFAGGELESFRLPQAQIDAAREGLARLLSPRSRKLRVRFVSSTSARSSRAGLPRARTARCSALR